MIAYHGSENEVMNWNSPSRNSCPPVYATMYPIAPETSATVMYAGFVSADGICATSTSRVIPPPSPPRSAISRIPTTVNCL